jgi:hypothetical protein
MRLLCPQNRDLAYRWMSSRNKAFDNLTPVEVAGWTLMSRFFAR